ncbi:hypothetical protein, conserved [Entamoeba dispar SAW760]|uniref:Redox-active protein (C_GCAxxG_C_C) n=1 Tax=Entamoeba dispar (strain ATCC PRA-260 / SAW760) TaxID=370354 RepID=B0EN07_ENTDS|nr:uncharacterized protein EDI_199210 [Entamoeba dispar SAW760]EDR24131.1 hypothetical protein, conserved [Entamoeba dispar SAW760]|eukprot:EDR24131.1 hypothetical protein, conserved [Entamoeba dispar SAW760]
MASISEIAVEYHSAHKGNCSQSVAYGYSEATGNRKELIEQLSGCGGGRAPEGYCGALYAAIQILGEDKKEACISKFKESSNGCTKCKEIRGSNVIPCRECVRAAAKCIEELA